MTFSDVVVQLERALHADLPGVDAQRLLAPRPRREWPSDFDPAHIRHAAGLLLVFPIADRAHIVLTVRADTLGRHRGQVSLPGGLVEPGETVEDAALREAHEEIGLRHDSVRVLGRLTAVDIPVSGFRLHPVVGITSARPPLTSAEGEVARILEVDVGELTEPDGWVSVEREQDGCTIVVPAFHVGANEIWGATAMVLAEFLVLLGWNPKRFG